MNLCVSPHAAYPRRAALPSRHRPESPEATFALTISAMSCGKVMQTGRVLRLT
jgi:hypothetical protein